MKENLQPNRIAHNKRPGSFGAFLLAIHKAATETAIQAEVKRAMGAGLDKGAIHSVLRNLSIKKLWTRDSKTISSTVSLTAKGLQYLQEHGLIAV